MQTVTDDDLLYVIISKTKSVGTHENDKIANGHNYETFVCSVCVCGCRTLELSLRRRPAQQQQQQL